MYVVGYTRSSLTFPLNSVKSVLSSKKHFHLDQCEIIPFIKRKKKEEEWFIVFRWSLHFPRERRAPFALCVSARRARRQFFLTALLPCQFHCATETGSKNGYMMIFIISFYSFDQVLSQEWISLYRYIMGTATSWIWTLKYLVNYIVQWLSKISTDN